MWSLEPESEAEKPEAIGLGSELKGVSVNPEGESRHRHVRATMARNERENQTRMEKEGKCEGTSGRGCGSSESERKTFSGGIRRGRRMM